MVSLQLTFLQLGPWNLMCAPRTLDYLFLPFLCLRLAVAAVLGIWIRLFLGFWDPDPLARCTDPDPFLFSGRCCAELNNALKIKKMLLKKKKFKTPDNLPPDI